MVAVGVLFWLLFVRIPPSGVRSFVVGLDGRSPWVNTFLPGQRVSDVGLQPGGWVGQSIYDEPVYETLRLPGVYQQVTLGFEFRPHDQPLMDLGLTHEPAADISIQPLWSQVLAQGWRRVVLGGRQGYVREGAPDEALGEQDMNKLLVWHASSTVPAYRDAVFQERRFMTALRGSYDLHAIPVQDKITFQLQIQDINRRRQNGAVVFTLSKNGELLWSEALSLAGSRDDRPSAVYTKSLSFDHLDAGVYKLSVVADDDIFTRKISSPLQHWVIGPRLYFGDQVGYATTTLPGIAWTNAQHIQLETFHPEGRQVVTLGGAAVEVKELHQEYLLDRLPQERGGIRLVQAPQGDVRLLADGYFSLAPDLLFLPAPRRLTDASRPLEEGIQAILTPYIPPVRLDDGWYLSSSTYRIQPRPGTLRLTLSAPNLQARQTSLDVRAVRVTYVRPALSWRDWAEAVWRELASAWRAL